MGFRCSTADRALPTAVAVVIKGVARYEQGGQIGHPTRCSSPAASAAGCPGLHPIVRLVNL